MLLNILLQASGGGIPFWVTMGGVMVIFYLFMILPQQRKQKQQNKFRESLAKGDDVVTAGGMHGKVHSVEGDTVVLLIDKSKITFDLHSISMEASQRVQNKQLEKKN